MEFPAGSPMREEELRHYLHMEPLIRGVFYNYGMPKMMAILEQTLEHPAMIIDMGFKIIDETPSVTADHRLYIRNDIFMVESCINRIKNHSVFKNMTSRAYSSLLIQNPEFQNFIVASLRVTNVDTMMLIVFEHGAPFTPLDYERIKETSRILAVQYQKSDLSFTNNRMILPNHIVFSLLNGEKVSREELLTRLNYVPWVTHRKLHLMIMDDQDEHADLRTRFSSVLFALRGFLPEEYCLSYRSFVISFLGPEQLKNLCETRRTEFERFLELNHLCCAIGPEYNDIMDSQTYYAATQGLLQSARNHHMAFAWFPEMHFQILYDLIRVQYPCDAFDHPVVKALREYDEASGSNLLETLAVYLECKSKPDAAADRLYIHRSTLFYRIKKIRELTGINLEDIAETARIYFSLQMDKLNGACGTGTFWPDSTPV